MHTPRCAIVVGIFVIANLALGQEGAERYKVTIKYGATQTAELTLPIDPQIRITAAHANGPQFGLTVEGKRITCSPNGSIWHQTRVDGQENQLFFGMGNPPRPLPDGPFGKKRHGFHETWAANNIQFTMVVEVVPSKPTDKAAPGQKRRMDTCLMTYTAENKDGRPHTVELRTNIDILIVNNDGALFAAPTTEPGKILDGVALQGNKLPEYLLVLERPNLKDPGFAATMTLKFGKSQNLDGPSRIVLTNLGALGQGGWDSQAVQANGDSACAIYWAAKELQPKQKRTMVWAYGGGIASSPENEGRVNVAFKGPFEPNKAFTITAYVEDPTPGQSLALQLPAGLECEGREIQPVPLPGATGTSVVEWRAKLQRPGDYELKVRSSTGVTQSKLLSVQRINALGD